MRLKTQDDFFLMYQAVINLMAHDNMLMNKTWDQFVKKGIELEKIKEVYEIYHYHTFFKYYPHYDVTEALIDKILERNINDELAGLILLLGKLPLVKLRKESRHKIEQIQKIVQANNKNKDNLERAFRRLLVDWL